MALTDHAHTQTASSPPATHTRNVSLTERAKRTLPSRLQTGFDGVRDFIAPRSPVDPPRGYTLPRCVLAVLVLVCSLLTRARRAVSDAAGHSRQATLQELGQIRDVAEERQKTVAQYIEEHPSYDRTLFLFSQRSPARKFCQALVEPAYGSERINGRPPIKLWQRAFQLVMLAVILASVAVAGAATPMYRRDYYLEHGEVRLTWFNIVEVSTGFLFAVEFLVKVTADGFLYAPNAYVLSVWNCIDFFVRRVGAALVPLARGPG